ncbi:MAG: response regulator transcription factor [Bacilli bacterium]|nr:response regulator transcription factor [Bacilli bacterium]
MEKINVMIVEDQAMPRALFEMYIKSNEKYNLVASIDNANVADIYCMKNGVDLILMDVITKGGASGLEASEKIKSMYPDTKIIIVTSMPEHSFIQKAKDIGIEGFWYKELNEMAIMDVVERVVAGERVYPSSTPKVQIGLCTSDDFTERELEVLRCIVKGYTDKEIASELYLSVETIHSKIKDLLSKTGYKSRTRLAVALMGSGLIIDDYQIK